ncbi:MAG TPA: iron-binding protein [Bacteroidales bacterium]|nr:iron-binding protein [Bacteroidales bacterium]
MNNPRKIAAKFHLTKYGPIRVEGKFSLVNLDGANLVPDNTKEVYLCGCGASRNKPFCDGSHKAANS